MQLYLLTFANGKQYVGISTIGAAERFVVHRSTAKTNRKLPLYKAWRKHGEPMLEVLGDYQDCGALLEAERVEIARRGTQIPNGYNVTHGGEDSPMRTASVAAKVAEAKRGKKRGVVHSPESRAKIAAAMRGRVMSEESRAKLSKARTGVPSPLRGRTLSDDMRARLSEAQKGRPKSAETRAKIADALRGQQQSDATKAKRKATWAAKKAANDAA